MTVLAPVGVTEFTLNGAAAAYRGPGGTRLLDVLRTEFGLTGTKEGCGEGECGACTVLVDGQPVDSCLVPIAQVAGRHVMTSEGLGDGGAADPLQRAFLLTGGVQCGFCTPGLLMAARAFLDSGAPVDDGSIREAIAGNLCRCTGYMKVVEAIAAVADGAPLPDLPSREAPEPVWVGPEPSSVLAGTDRRAGPPLIHPSTLAEALDALADGACRPVAGGTDLMVGLAAGAIPDGVTLLDLGGLDELRGIELRDSALHIGALTTFGELRASPLVRHHVPALAEMAASVGAAQIQARATIGGNTVTASPAGDSLPVLLACDAAIIATGSTGERAIRAADFWTAYRRTALAPGELVARIVVPLPSGRTVRFRKVGTRRAQAISKVVMAVAWRTHPGSRAWHDVRVGIGSVAEVPIRALRAEAELEGAVPGADRAERAAAAVAADVRPIDDVRSTAAYRRAVTARILRRIVLDAAAEAER